MNKVFLLFSMILLSYVYSNAQNPYYEEVNFSYVRNPLQPLPKEIKSYSVVANIAYADDVAQQKENWEKAKEEKIKQNETDKQEYKEKSLGAKVLGNVLLDEEKPKDVEIGEKYFSKVYSDADVTARIKLDGYDISESSDIKIEVALLGFEYVIEEDIVEEKKDDVVTKKYRYKISYKHPIEIKILDGFDEELHYLEMPDLKNYSTKNTKQFSHKYELENYWKENKISYLSKLDQKATNTNLKTIDNYINSEFGYSKMTRESSIAMVKPKKYEYNEYFNAYEQIFTGYNYIIENKEDADNYIKEAIDNWENALNESDQDDKKARINLKVTAVTHLNCVEAYCWLNDFQSARRHIMKIKMLKTKKYDRRVDALQQFVEDQEKRFKASVEI